jgi:hypothetical protein
MGSVLTRFISTRNHAVGSGPIIRRVTAPHRVFKLFLGEDARFAHFGEFPLPLIEDRPSETFCFFRVRRAGRLPSLLPQSFLKVLRNGDTT